MPRSRRWPAHGLPIPPAGPTALGSTRSAPRGPRLAEIARIENVVIDQLISAGQRGAFHLTCTGPYSGVFEDIDPARIGATVALRLAGIFDVAGGSVSRVQVTADRLGLHRSLMGAK
jgi:hypothetical protein